MITRRRLMTYSGAALAVGPLALAQIPGVARRRSERPKTRIRTFANPQSLEILSYTTRSSKIAVSGFRRSRLFHVSLTLHNLSHDLLGPVSFLLVAPGGRNVIPLSDVVANNVSNVTLTLDDFAERDIPASPPLTSGAYRPRNYGSDTASDFNPMDVPPISGNEKLSTFHGIDPNGEWTLYVYNANAINPGSLAGGWSLEITAVAKRIKR
jgi:subtilisin-like proprotein convertase family protein